MTNSKDKSRLKSLLSEPLLLNGEDREAYDELLAAVIETVQPSDILEHIWTSEAVEKQWEALRQRRFKTAYIAANWQRALRATLYPLISYGLMGDLDDRAGMLAWKYTMGDQAAIAEVDKLLADANLTKEAVHAQAMAMHVETFATFERLIWAAEARRDASLREIEYHRAPFGQKLRRAIAQAEKAEIQKSEPPAEQKLAA
ncbi:MAG: hypothetical protein WAR76_12840 [Xanthobacteraceae bacterium]